MKTVTTLLGALLIVAGALALAYQGFSYTKQEKIFQVGDVKVTADTKKTVYLPPVLGGLSLVAGVALVVLGRRTRKVNSL